jgi:hypothetical protein
LPAAEKNAVNGESNKEGICTFRGKIEKRQTDRQAGICTFRGKIGKRQINRQAGRQAFVLSEVK